jgi:hypothetical protein
MWLYPPFVQPYDIIVIEFATYSLLRALSEDLDSRASFIVEAAQKRSSQQATVFLSHSTKDAALLPAVIRILEGHGGSVYVDKIDSSLPSITSRATADILRGRIKAIKKFVLFATKQSADSKWIPWELGLADGYRSPFNTCIFPGAETAYDTSWSEREYLGIYDRVVWGDLEGHKDQLWMVLNQEANVAIPLTNWLKQ